MISSTIYAKNETKIYTTCIEGYVFVVSETKIGYLDDAIIKDIEQLFVIGKIGSWNQPVECHDNKKK